MTRSDPETPITGLSAAAVEIAGRNWLTAQLLARGLEVATPVVDRGIDLIVFREVGTQRVAAGKKLVSLQAAALVSDGRSN